MIRRTASADFVRLPPRESDLCGPRGFERRPNIGLWAARRRAAG